MFDSVSARSIQMLKPLGLIAAIHLLNVAGVFSNIYKWIAFNVDNAYKSTYNTITGMNFTWIFMKGQTMPVQMGYTNSEYRHKAEWFFNERTQNWIHRNAEYHAPANYFPFVMTTLTTPEGEFDLTEYFNGQTYYFGNGRRTMPLPAQLLNMWCMQTHKWFTSAELRESYFTIMGTDCNTYTIPVILRTADGVRIYSELFGMRIPESDEESSTEDEESSAEDEEDEEDAEEEEGTEEEEDKEEQLADAAAEEDAEEEESEEDEEEQPADAAAEQKQPADAAAEQKQPADAAAEDAAAEEKEQAVVTEEKQEEKQLETETTPVPDMEQVD
jgi:hypothetical protein